MCQETSDYAARRWYDFSTPPSRFRHRIDFNDNLSVVSEEVDLARGPVSGTGTILGDYSYLCATRGEWAAAKQHIVTFKERSKSSFHKGAFESKAKFDAFVKVVEENAKKAAVK